MPNNEMNISRASEADLEGILALQAANQLSNGGTLSGAISRAKIVTIMQEMPLIVSRHDNRVTGFLITGTREMYVDVPIINAMLAAYSGTTDAYIYGPICVSAEERGKGIAQAMFTELQRWLPGREAILFIRRDNLASMRAHAKMGMHEVANFVLKGVEYAVLSNLE